MCSFAAEALSLSLGTELKLESGERREKNKGFPVCQGLPFSDHAAATIQITLSVAVQGDLRSNVPMLTEERDGDIEK
jgi:hypothetical protein